MFIVFASCSDDNKAKEILPDIPFSIYGKWANNKGDSLTIDSSSQQSMQCYGGRCADYTFTYTNIRPKPYILFTDKSIWKIVTRWDINILDTNKFSQVKYPANVLTKK